MSAEHTTAAVQRYLNDLAGERPAEPIVRALLDRAVRRLQTTVADPVRKPLVPPLPTFDIAPVELATR